MKYLDSAEKNSTADQPTWAVTVPGRSRPSGYREFCKKKVVLFLAILALSGCVRSNYRACIVSQAGTGCTRYIPKVAAQGIAEYIGRYDPDAIIIVVKKGQKQTKLPEGHPPIPVDPPKAEDKGEKI